MKKKTVYYCSKIISTEDIYDIFFTITIMFKKYFPREFRWVKKSSIKNIWKNKKFHKSIILARSNSPKKFGCIYDSIQLTTTLKKIMCSKKILNLIERISGKKKETFIAFDSLIRFDPPFDKRNTIDWHYDQYPTMSKNMNTKYGYTLQISLHDTLNEHGSPIFCLGSDKKKIKQSIVVGKNNKSDDYVIPIKYLKDFRQKSYETKSGDALLFPMNVIHKSGDNISDEVRISLLFRYYPILKSNFIPMKVNYNIIEQIN